MNKEQFIQELSKLGLDLTEEQLSSLDTYCKFLLEYNTHTNLTAIKEEDQVYLKHFYDSLTFIKAIDLNNINNLIDIGTGAGFPGMVLKIIFPNVSVTLLDSNNKKIKFLEELSTKLNLDKINFYHGRAEDFCVNNRETFDIVTARAVSNLPMLLELCLPLTKVKGRFVALKGSNYKEELVNSNNALKVLNGKVFNVKEYTLLNDVEKYGIHSLIEIIKEKENSSIYPRSYSLIKKKPL
jgi:16S rRNA (guanine527-N7)-methyltransferase